MLRNDIINTIGREFLTASATSEEGEFFYNDEFQKIGKDWDSIKIKNIHETKRDSFYRALDIRFLNKEQKLTICIETKKDYKKNKKIFEMAKDQLNAYMKYERMYSGNKVIGILANTTYNDIIVYEDCVNDVNVLDIDRILSMDDFIKHLFPVVKNSKENVMNATYKLNQILHGFGIEAKIRGQFVGTCLLALKNNLEYQDGKGVAKRTSVVIAEIKDILGDLLDDSINKAEKLILLSKNVLDNEKVQKLSNENLNEILNHINNKILPFINDDTTAGQDILNLFFTMFNKYVDKDDKNQAFTPDHITDFMCKITGVDYNSRVLDPCCGSGAFLVRALVTARNSCAKLPNRDEIIDRINKTQIYGIEYSEKPYGLSTTNMLIHGDGNTNVIKANCFDKKDWIMNEVKPTVILMNPPYNAQQIGFPKEIVDYIDQFTDKKGKTIETKVLKTYSTGSWPSKKGKPAKEDPTKGLCFVDYISDCLHDSNTTNVKLAVLLPLQCAIGNNGLMLRAKENILKHNTLDAVFTLPPEMFYPGASANACCMLFTMGVPHCNTDGKPNKKTFFGYCKEDGFIKKKYLGRIEQMDKNNNSIWKTKIEPKWIELFNNGDVETGLSAKEYVTASDEWLCEAYMKTDYSLLNRSSFQQSLNNYYAHLVENKKNAYVDILDTDTWKEFKITNLFDVCAGTYYSKDDYEKGDTPYISASDTNNGVGFMTDLKPDFTGNKITIGKIGATAYYQPDSFCATSDVNILTPLFPMNKYTGLFITQVINTSENYKWSYGRQCRIGDTKKIVIKLPIRYDDSGNTLIDKNSKFSKEGYIPDLQFMENYIRSLDYADNI